MLLQETQQQLKTGNFESVDISREGEPTLRLGALLGLAKKIGDDTTLPLRLTTNGLIYQQDTAEMLKSNGVSFVSVALVTRDPDQYDKIMTPNIQHNSIASEDNAPRPHGAVCHFIQTALAAGLTVEATGVARQDVNQEETEEFAKALGIIEKFRWRPYVLAVKHRIIIKVPLLGLKTSFRARSG